MQEGEIQRELLKETRSAEKALEVAINFEMDIQIELKISRTAAHSNSNQAANMSIIQKHSKFLEQTQTFDKNYVEPTICRNCGY